MVTRVNKKQIVILTSLLLLVASFNIFWQSSGLLIQKLPFRHVMSMKSPLEVACNETRQIIFIKTHKTASSTTNNIIQRFGYTRGLAFALPKRAHIFDENKEFSRGLLYQQNPADDKGKYFNIIASHLRYNRPELDKVVTNATYITILREPVRRFESAFGYYNFALSTGLRKSKNPLADFMKSPDMYIRKVPGIEKNRLRNGMFYNLGFDSRLSDDNSVINATIETLDKELDLVLIADYYDESLVLLKNVLCWKIQDLLYISKGIRSENRLFEIPKLVADKILKWNKADALLYNHFNDTFWRRVLSYGDGFYQDLNEFRMQQQKFYEECVDVNRTTLIQGREAGLVMKTNASTVCEIAFHRDVEFTALLKKDSCRGRNKTYTEKLCIEKQQSEG